MQGLFSHPNLIRAALLLGLTIASFAPTREALAQFQFQYPAGDPRNSALPPLNVRDFGAVGNGIVDDTATIQRAVNTAMLGVQKVVYFPPGVYLVNSIKVGAGITLLADGATMKVLPNSGEFNVVFTSHRHWGWEQFYWSSDVDSPPLVVYGFQYDGNYAEQGPYLGHQLEHQAFLSLTADATKKGRLVAVVQNCHGRDGVGDFVYAYTNVALNISRCTAHNVFRGLLVVGGSANVVGTDLVATGDRHRTGFDVEPNSAGQEGVVDIRLSNIRLEGDFDICAYEGSKIYIEDMITGPPFNLVNRGANIEIVNSKFEIGKASSANRIRVRDSGGITTFRNCDFNATKPIVVVSPDTVTTTTATTTTTDVYYAMRLDWRGGAGHQVIFDNCRFDAVNVRGAAAIMSEPDQMELANVLVLKNSQISSNFSWGLLMAQGGNWDISNSRIEARIPMYLDHKDKYFYSARLSGIQLGPSVQYYMRMDHGAPQNVVAHQSLELTAAQNRIWNSGGSVSANSFRGQRIIRGDADPTETGTPGLLGDLYIRRSGSLEERWQCVSTDTKRAKWVFLYSRPVQ